MVLGAVVLAVTGAEALYADMGHFGNGPIRLAWFGLVLPALVLNYFGQGALLIARPAGGQEPVLPAAAGLGAVPDGRARHGGDRDRLAGDRSRARTRSPGRRSSSDSCRAWTSAHLGEQTIGQIYIPSVNWILYVAAVLVAVLVPALVAISPSRLRRGGDRDHAGGHAAHVLRDPLRLGATRCWLCLGATGSLHPRRRRIFRRDLLKVADGGWFPLVIGACVFTLMTTWRRGREHPVRAARRDVGPLEPFLDSLLRDPPQRVPGTAVFLTATPASCRTRCCTT